jgi:hypothetical protein
VATSSPPPKRLWTRNQAGALPTEAVRCKLSVRHEVQTEVPVYCGFQLWDGFSFLVQELLDSLDIL